MRFKSERIRAEWFGADQDGRRITPTMKEVALQAIRFAETHDWDPELTEVLRTPLENDLCYGGHGDHMMGVHVVGRGVDVSIRGISRELVRAVIDHVNADWVYDPARPLMRCALLHEKPAEPGPPYRPPIVPHLHLQVFPTTVERTFPDDRRASGRVDLA